MLDLVPETAALVDAAWRAGLALDRQMTVSQWADTYRLLPNSAAEPGQWRTARTPYLREIMDVLSTSSAIERVAFMKGSQVGGTEVGLNALGYWIDHAPGTIMLVMQSLDATRVTSKGRIDPLIETTPALRRKILPARARDSGNTISHKEFAGGSLMLTAANSPKGLRSTAARYLVLDEVDGFPPSAGKEGDPVQLAIQRTATFKGRRKIFMVSTPTLAGVSRIEQAYAESDQRKFEVPCPHCGAYQALEWSGVKWPEGKPAEAYYACSQCGGVIEDSAKQTLLAAGKWVATAEGDGRTAGFHLSALYSPFESWGEIAADFLASKSDPDRLMAWTNLKLGEPFEDRDTAPLSPESLQNRAEASEHDWTRLLPDGVLVITAGVDVQDDRLEVEIVGWGLGEESWSLDYRIIHGRTDTPEPWAALDQLLLTRFRHPRAVPDLPIAAAAIDSGGHRTGEVMQFSAARLNRRVWAIKGRGGPGVPPWPHRPPKLQRGSVAPLHMIGVDGIKHTLMGRLRLDRADGAGVVHAPERRDWFWFAGLVAERAVRRFSRGVARIEWIADPAVRNEPLDCRVYATAALHGLYVSGLDPAREAERIQVAPTRSDSLALCDPLKAGQKIIRSGFMQT